MDDYKVFNDFISNMMESDWKIVFDRRESKVEVVNDKGQEIDLDSLEFILGELGDYAERKREELYGEERKEPIDEFNIKRLKLQHYTVVNDTIYGNCRDIFEAYYDQAGTFTINRYTVNLESNVKYSGSEFTACLNEAEAEKLLHPLQAYVSHHKKVSKK